MGTIMVFKATEKFNTLLSETTKKLKEQEEALQLIYQFSEAAKTNSALAQIISDVQYQTYYIRGYTLGLFQAWADTMGTENYLNSICYETKHLIKKKVNEFVLDKIEKEISSGKITDSSVIDIWKNHKPISFKDLSENFFNAILSDTVKRKIEEVFPYESARFVSGFAEAYNFAFYEIVMAFGFKHLIITDPLSQDIWKNLCYFTYRNALSYELNGTFYYQSPNDNLLSYKRAYPYKINMNAYNDLQKVEKKELTDLEISKFPF